MLIPVRGPMNLAATLYSGQAFRWRPQGEWSSGVVAGNAVRVRQTAEGLEFRCAPDGEAELAPRLADYLGLSADLEAIYATISADGRIGAAIHRYRGMRILRQDPWECLVSFICSSASNIPRISRNVESLCTSFGRPVGSGDLLRHTFPTPETLAVAGEAPLRALGLGYRAGYLATTSGAVAQGSVDLMSLRQASYESALDSLTGLAGVGDKVANCVLLFSLDKPQAFPVDVWIHRAVEEWYLDGVAKSPSVKNMRLWAQERFGPFAGYANQYLFHERRLMSRT